MTVDYVGIGEASEVLGMSKTSIQKLVDSNQLAAVKTSGGHRRILRSSIEALNEKMGPKALLRLAASSQQIGREPYTTNTLSPAENQHDLHVLLVEDDAATAALLVGVLTKNYPELKCTVATDGLDAVLRLERMRPRLLITDLNMEPFDGFTLIKMVSARSEYHSVVIVAVSGMSDKDVEKRGGLPSNVLLFRKPISMERLKGFVDAHVQLHRQALRACPEFCVRGIA
ncbi:MAG: hypothetical protein B7X59_00480 [Polaromonas sp. 39-63-203]|jgi:excisionase family DNA binding protein|uniref:response regulator n=1 Tax=Polaromonas sp. TaxID=1869339 RepID=UPI000BC7DBD9|nr:response regulator [Polaromonas sp.]OYY53708.1 MAG: hypothetical protein B7Y54_01815 [Polaromonas sp. 35-63-240]OYZ03415.1 MAG: hypothetical protein B7Y42_00665 [Polaromonas sp. 28-63-22]OYZ85280.1 MAG: hypothetical protein B7Y03_00345 [Polaromonas sp. 24-62-144]OZB02418.1 MAG: hypothetical protein B7X59_00480 [Polaromonas sp. 39-63-203]HQS31388.1 response regulator [Polaromonas sp.]